MKKSSLFLKIFTLMGISSLLAIALSQELKENRGFKGTLLEFIKTHAREDEAQSSAGKSKSPGIEEALRYDTEFVYRKGDWQRYVTGPKYEVVSEGLYGQGFRIEERDKISVNSYGSLVFDMTYGKSEFTKDKYFRFDEDKPESRVIEDGFNFDREIKLHMEGDMGRRMTVYIDHDSRKEDNHYEMQYRAIEKDEVIREINAGEIDIDFQHSKYPIYDDTSSRGLGMDLTLRRGDLSVKAFGSVTKGVTETEIFKGNSSPNDIKLSDYQYVKNTYYQLEPFSRYDGLTSPPAPSPENYNTLVTFTSSPPDPASYMPGIVNVDPRGFELYMDDQNPHNNLNSIRLSAVDGGYYDRLVSGVDYKINYSTGLITIIKSVSPGARIFALYTRNNGSTVSSDPASRTDIFQNKIFVFIKYGYSIDEDSDKDFILDAGEDRNGDGRLNLDEYEVRSVYRIGERQIIEDNFSLQFFKNNEIMRRSDVSRLGRYSIDYSEGIIKFSLREPFRQVLQGRAVNIYSENQTENVYLYSQYNIRVDYYRESRSFQLKHVNIIPDSVRIKINGRELPSSLYSIDHTSGFLEFTDPNNPVISDETEIEIKYEYLPLGARPKTLVAGVRSDYRVNRNINIGGTLLFTRDSGSDLIPDAGSEPGQTLILEADTSIEMTEGSLKKLVRQISGQNVNSIPLEIRGYAEYARSYRKINTFGKALLDDMESTEEVVSVSLSEKEWVLSSMPGEIPGLTQEDRGKLYYYYYRNPKNPGTLRGEDFTPYSVPYPKKPGPYNIAAGHVPDKTQDIDSQRSLVFNFDFSSGDYIPVVTRELSEDAADFSGLQYMEIWFKPESGEGEVELYVDIGEINEDSDGDGIMDTEDKNNNGILDFDPDADIDEDTGYIFNPTGSENTVIGAGPGLSKYTTGNGVLNTEDLNRNGLLETNENIVRIPGSSSYPNDSSTPLVINLNNRSWQKARIYLDRSSDEYSEKKELLKRVKAVRIFLKKRGTNNRGTIYVDSLKFISMSWRDGDTESFIENDPGEFRITKIDTISDSDYRAESYMLFSKDNYESLHGDKSASELKHEKETALQIEYNFETPGRGSATRKFQKNIDLRYYKTLNTWFNFKDFSPGDSISVIIGSSENDYIEYMFPMEHREVWREVSLKLKENSTGDIAINDIKGNPDFKRINFFRITVNGQGAGKFWVNDIYVSEPEMLSDSASWYEGEIKFKKPLFRTDEGLPVFSDFNIKYIHKGYGAEFSTIGKTSQDIAEKQDQLFSEVMVLPNWSARMDFIAEKSETDSLNELVIESKRGETEKRSFNFISDYKSNIYALPSIKLIYKQDGYENRREEFLSALAVHRETENSVYSPALVINERLEEILWGDLSATLIMDTSFKKEEVRSYDNTSDTEEAENSLSLEEIENRQKADAGIKLDYCHEYFFIRPSVNIRSHEIVQLSGRNALNDTEILSDVNGDFHFPFVYNKDFKFIERDKKGKIEFGINETGMISPVLGIELFYIDYGFRDYGDIKRERSGRFARSKDAESFISNRIDIPFSISRTGSLDFIRSVVFSYSRTFNLKEEEIPYEGEETSAFNEKYGPARTYSGLAADCLNLFSSPPWRFFRGRENFANGRDYAYKKFNGSPKFPDGTPVPEYNNSFRIIDSFSLGSTLDFEMISLTPNAGVTHTSERQIIFGIPQEAITGNADLDLSFDLMQIFSFGFFRPNKIGLPYHSASLRLGYGFMRNMIITSNIEETSHIPGAGVTLKRDRTSVGFDFEFEYKRRNDKEYICPDDSKRDPRDDIYIENMQSMEPFKEIDKTYLFTCFYETDVLWLYDLFSKLYTLAAYPIFFCEYSLLLNKYDYTETLSPEPYDQHLVTLKLTLDLHKNVQGGLTGRWALEKFRNRETGGVNREIRSYEAGINFSLLF